MNISEIEALLEVKQATLVLQQLEKRGLQEPAIAAGWTRSLLTNAPTSDIDVSYVGPVHYEDAQTIFPLVLKELGVDDSRWDVKGIWNAEMAYGVVHTVDNFCCTT